MSQKDAPGSLQNVLIHPEILQKVFVDEQGDLWQFVEQERSHFGGIWKSTRVELQRCTDSSKLGTSLKQVLRHIAQEGFSRWKENTAQPELAKLASATEPLLKKCLDDGERNFRKELLAAMGTQGQKLFAKLVEDKFDEIAQIAKEEQRASQAVFTTDGPFPANVRFRWQLKTPKHTYTAFCLETPPQRRTITIFGEKRRLVFPWMCFLVYFLDGDLFEHGNWSAARDHDLCGLGVFYRPKELQSQGDALYFCNLPEVNYKMPYGTCLGASRPVIKLTDPSWQHTLLDWFWTSTFYYNKEIMWSINLWYQAANAIPEMKNINQWEEVSRREDCFHAVCALPWVKCDYNVGQMAKAMLEYCAQNDDSFGKSQKKIHEERESALGDLAVQFREQLEEKILFLGAHFYIPQDVLKPAREFLSAQLAAITSKIDLSLARQCAKISEEARQKLVCAVSRKGEFDATLPDMVSRQSNAETRSPHLL